MNQPLRERLAAFGIRPRRRFGQNFLHEQGALSRIATAVGSDRPIVEIGPGPGTLTDALLALGPQVVAVEKDRDMVRLLRAHFAAEPRLTVVEGDVLELAFEDLPGASKPTVVGNLPYNISSPILLHLLRQRAKIGPAIVMLQAELAERLAAPVGSRAAGSLTVLFSATATVQRLFELGPGAFFPPPKVRSAVVRISWRDLCSDRELEVLEKVVRAGFSQRRKTLRNALRGLEDAEPSSAKPDLERLDGSRIGRAAEAIDLDLDRRAESLSLPEWRALSAALFPGSPGEVSAPGTRCDPS